MRVPTRWFVEPVEVRTYAGQGAYGDSFGDPVTVLGHVSGGRRLQGSTEQEIVSERRVLLPNPARLADGSGTVDPTTLLTPESEVVSGSVTAVIQRVDEHRQPGTGTVVYVSGVLG